MGRVAAVSRHPVAESPVAGRSPALGKDVVAALGAAAVPAHVNDFSECAPDSPVPRRKMAQGQRDSPIAMPTGTKGNIVIN
ncbi:tsl1160 [Thermosynechococcus vestitus BP-1]|uniref:Tsl1160 protein n=1 Tax=Thermosynechococcus vestitus (strain NIES-2133 / IAM M-273 / BP-1) TaxID=197221 RepID=Q8DJR2_THEVB|nr:tsl1160 [Thermosynechococcus vestitus BP-1]